MSATIPTKVAGAALVALAVVAYGNTFNVPFVFDDPSSLLTNSSIRSLWPPWAAFFPPPLVTVSGRPVVNFTFALNHAISGTAPWSYHAVNLAIHALAGLAMFGLLRRTLGRAGLAWGVATLWTLHPLQTEAVTYTVQRVESLMSLFYLLTLYAFVRSTTSPTPWRWLVLSVVACALGMGSKEVMVSAPLLVLLYDRTFVTGSIRAAWQARAGYYGALAATWVLLAALVFSTAGRGGTAGFGAEVSAWNYALTQARALLLYLKLAVWPNPLVFDYGTTLVRNPATALLPALIILALIVATFRALRARSPLGVAGVGFFAILAPTTSFVPVATQTMAEHRMYLPLAAVLVVGAVALHAAIGRRALAVTLGAALAFTGLAAARNQTYRHDLTLWRDTVAKRPTNPRAHYNVAVGLADAGRSAEAIASYEAALRLDPTYAEAHNNLGVLLDAAGRHAEAIPHYEATLRVDPDNPEAHNNLGHTFAQVGRVAEAMPHYEAALRLRPDYPEAHNNFGEALAQSGRAPDALPHFEAAIRARPAYAQAHGNLGSALLELGRAADAMPRLEEALRLKPDFAEAHSNLALALLGAGRLDAAAEHYTAVLRLAPHDATAHSNLGYIALQQGRTTDAIGHYEAAARERPNDAPSHFNLGAALARAARWSEAAAAFERALALQPGYEDARRQLAQARARLGR